MLEGIPPTREALAMATHLRVTIPMRTRVPKLLLKEEADPGHLACLMPVVIPELVVVAIASYQETFTGYNMQT